MNEETLEYLSSLEFLLSPNVNKKHEKAPDHWGKIKDQEGNVLLDIAGWNRRKKADNSPFISIKFSKPWKKEEAPVNPPDALFDSFNAASLDTDPDCPF